MRLHILLAVALVASAALASPIADAGTLRTASRVANFGDVAHTFVSAYKFSDQCPDKLVIAKISDDTSRNIGRVAIPDIAEDGQQCRGTGNNTMFLVSEATVKEPGLLARLNFNKAARALTTNRAALATVQNSKSDSSLLVGFDEGTRTCGASVWNDQSFFFFIREPSRFRVLIRTDKEKALVAITLPPNTRALFMSDGDRKLCMMYDQSTTAGRNVAVVASNSQGSPVPVVTPTASSSKSPKASPSAPAQSPAAATPSLTPSPTFGTVPQNTETPSSAVGETTLPVPAGTANATGGSVCFPAHVQVELAGGRHVPISALRLGDRVRTGATSFSDVFMFTHNASDVRHAFVRLVTRSGKAVTLTASHYLMASGRLAAAGAVRLGDTLQLADGTRSEVAAVEAVTSTGLYNPQTLDGSLVVDGIVTSCYTTAVHVGAAHGALLAPLRAAYSMGAKGTLHALSRVVGESAQWLGGWAPSGSPVMG